MAGPRRCWPRCSVAPTWSFPPVVGFFEGVSNLAGLRDQNDRLEAEVRELELRLRETEALERKVAELEAINDLAPPLELAAVSARVYSSGASSYDHVRYIPQGLR